MVPFLWWAQKLVHMSAYGFKSGSQAALRRSSKILSRVNITINPGTGTDYVSAIFAPYLQCCRVVSVFLDLNFA